mmetsp:Transcript_6742/g.22760  ORF Transcript_6742/g.22760 Transcript_6742/m.22760 type:complete len:204 (+) Transcript_6742:307-918(+)
MRTLNASPCVSSMFSRLGKSSSTPLVDREIPLPSGRTSFTARNKPPPFRLCFVSNGSVTSRRAQTPRSFAELFLTVSIVSLTTESFVFFLPKLSLWSRERGTTAVTIAADEPGDKRSVSFGAASFAASFSFTRQTNGATGVRVANARLIPTPKSTRAFSGALLRALLSVVQSLEEGFASRNTPPRHFCVSFTRTLSMERDFFS